MASNIEIKARVKDFSRLTFLAGQMSDSPEEILVQEDIFFFLAPLPAGSSFVFFRPPQGN
jgi:hypothetical protein